MNNSIFFRFEINKKIGSGHAVRCLRIANFLNKKSFDVYLIISNNSYNNIKKNDINISNNFKIIKIKNSSTVADAQNTINLIKKLKLKSKIYIFKDIYKLSVRWDNIIMSEYSRLIILDDFFNKKHNCKTYINYNLNNLNQIKYTKKKTKYLVGHKYFPFIQKKIKKVRKNQCLIYFGASDNKNLTLKVIKILNKIKLKKIKFIVLVGKFNANKVKIKKIIKHKNFVLIEKFINLQKIYNNCKFMIGTGGTSLWEALVNNLYPLIIPSHKNHVIPCLYLAKRKKIKLIRNLKINETLNKNYFQNYFMSSVNNNNNIDKNGLKRIYNNIK